MYNSQGVNELNVIFSLHVCGQPIFTQTYLICDHSSMSFQANLSSNDAFINLKGAFT